MAIVGADKETQDADIDLNARVDDNADAIVEAPESRQRVEEQRDAPKVKEGPQPDHTAQDKRQAIAEKLKAQRDTMDRNPQRVDIPDAMERLQAGPNVNTRMDRIREPEPEKKPEDIKTAADIPPPVKRVLKVNGRDIEVDEDQFTDFARRGAASDDILDQAKLQRAQARQKLDEVERLQAELAQKRSTEPQPQQSVKAEDSKPATDDELDTIIDQIQFGDKSDAAKALRTYGDQLVARARENATDTESKVTALVSQTLDNERVRDQTQRALDSFMSENTDFASSDRRMGVLVDETLTVMEQNLLSYGVTKETIDGYAKANGLPPSVAVSTAYRRLRTEGHQLPDQSAVLVTAAANVRREFGMPDPSVKREVPVRQVPDNSNFVAERTARKQAIVEQPRRANIAPAELPTPPANTEENRNAKYRQAVQQMRQMRRGR